MGDMMDDNDEVREGGAEDVKTGDAATFKLARNCAGSKFWRRSETSLRWSNATKKRVKSKLVGKFGVEGVLVSRPLRWFAHWSCGLATGKSRKFCPRYESLYRSWVKYLY